MTPQAIDMVRRATFPSRFVAKAFVGKKLGVTQQQPGRRGRVSALISVTCHEIKLLRIADIRHGYSASWTLQPDGGHRTEPSGSLADQTRTTRGDSLGDADFEHPGAAHRAGAFGRWPTILHRDRLGI